MSNATPKRPATISPKPMALFPRCRFWPYRDAVAVDIHSNMLLLSPLLVTEEFLIGWPVRRQNVHAAHTCTGADQPAGSGDECLHMEFVFETRGCAHIVHAFQVLSQDRLFLCSRSQPAM